MPGHQTQRLQKRDYAPKGQSIKKTNDFQYMITGHRTWVEKVVNKKTLQVSTLQGFEIR
jgi:hypothetical protein